MTNRPCAGSYTRVIPPYLYTVGFKDNPDMYRVFGMASYRAGCQLD